MDDKGQIMGFRIDRCQLVKGEIVPMLRLEMRASVEFRENLGAQVMSNEATA